MLNATIATVCCILVLVCISPCSSQQMCDVERWVEDNEVPINRLDVSSTSKSKLVQSIRSADKLIKCSELRLIHKEAELERQFKQNRYKVKPTRGDPTRKDDRHRDNASNNRGRKDSQPSQVNREKSDDKDDQPELRSLRREENEDDRRQSRLEDSGEAADQPHQSVRWNEEDQVSNAAKDEREKREKYEQDQQLSHLQQSQVKEQHKPDAPNYDLDSQLNQQESQSLNASEGIRASSTTEDHSSEAEVHATTDKPPSTAGKSTSTVEESASTVEESASTEKKHASTQEKPTSTEKEPKSTEKEPTSTEKEPTSTVEKPATIEKKTFFPTEIPKSKMETSTSMMGNTAFTKLNVSSAENVTAHSTESTISPTEGVTNPTENTAFSTDASSTKENLMAEDGGSTLEGLTSIEKDHAPSHDAFTAAEDTSAEKPDASPDHELEMTERLKLYFNESTNRTRGLRSHNRSANLVSNNQSINWMQFCFTCSRENRTRSWRFCRLLNWVQSAVATHKSTGCHVPSLSSLLCQTSATENINRSIHFCEAFFPYPLRYANVTKLPEYSINNTGIQTPNHLTKETTDAIGRALVDATNFVLSCRQCSALTISDGDKWLNRTRSICVFATEIYSQSSTMVSRRKQQLLVDSLQFIDDTVSANSEIPLPAGGGELQETELPTRVRHETNKLDKTNSPISEKSNATSSHTIDHLDSINNQADKLDLTSIQTSEQPTGANETNVPAAALDDPQSNASVKSAVASDAEKVAAKQLETLSHSVFMEKLFDSLMSKRKKADPTWTNSSLSPILDRLNERLDQLFNVTSQKSNRSELDELKSHLHIMEVKLARALDQIEKQAKESQNFVAQMQRLHLTTSAKISVCQKQLNKTNTNLKFMAKRHVSQLAQMMRRMVQMSNRMRRTESKCNRTVLQPIVPPVLQPMPDSQNHPHWQYRNGQTHVATATLPNVHGKSVIEDCLDIYTREKKLDRGEVSDGIFAANLGLTSPVQVRCDMRNGGWTYLLSRRDGKIDFFRNWTSYRTGFGDPTGEHFIGLDALAAMTAMRRYKLWVDLEDWEGNVRHVNYGHFQVLGERQKFQLLVDYFNGDPAVGDCLSSHSNASFSTFDFDNDLVENKFGGNCARRFRGGFWYFSCYRANPTGQYYLGGRIPDKRCDGIVWKTWKGPHYSLRSIHMKIRPL